MSLAINVTGVTMNSKPKMNLKSTKKFILNLTRTVENVKKASKQKTN